MKLQPIAYWTITGLFGLAMLAGGLADLARPEAIVESMNTLGYPAYFTLILGTWKILGALAVVVPGLPRLKEWAYAGFAFSLSGAALSHLLAGEPVGTAVPALALLALGVGSYLLRPAHRRWTRVVRGTIQAGARPQAA